MVTREKLLTLSEVAERLNVAKPTVMRAVQKGTIKARKLGWQWFVNEKDIPDGWPLR